MAKARRAKTRPARVAVPVVVGLLVIVAGVGATQGWFSGSSSTTANPSPSAAGQPTAGPTGSAAPDASSSATPAKPRPSDSQSATAATDSANPQALTDCRAKVAASDRTLQAAQVGIGHWAEHVQAQTDANAGKINVDDMNAIFKRTRLDGPDDVKRYDDAVQSAAQQSGSCKSTAGVTASVQKHLNRCAARAAAQQPVLRAASNGMDDWKSHLAAMQRSRMGHVNDPQGVWIRAWQAAPPHIKAFAKAEKAYDPPSC